jgi:hypothetical protein
MTDDVISLGHTHISRPTEVLVQLSRRDQVTPLIIFAMLFNLILQEILLDRCYFVCRFRNTMKRMTAGAVGDTVCGSSTPIYVSSVSTQCCAHGITVQRSPSSDSLSTDSSCLGARPAWTRSSRARPARTRHALARHGLVTIDSPCTATRPPSTRQPRRLLQHLIAKLAKFTYIRICYISSKHIRLLAPKPTTPWHTTL